MKSAVILNVPFQTLLDPFHRKSSFKVSGFKFPSIGNGTARHDREHIVEEVQGMLKQRETKFPHVV
jgi:hypothetical protein